MVSTCVSLMRLIERLCVSVLRLGGIGVKGLVWLPVLAFPPLDSEAANLCSDRTEDTQRGVTTALPIPSNALAIIPLTKQMACSTICRSTGNSRYDEPSSQSDLSR